MILRDVFPPQVSMADGFQCLPASRNECGKLLRTLTNDDAYSLFRSRALFRGVDVLVHENLVLTTHNGDSAEASSSLASAVQTIARVGCGKGIGGCVFP